MRGATLLLAVVTFGLGAAVIVRTAAAGGDGLAFGYLFGGGLIVAGSLRLYLALSRGGARRHG